MTPARISAFFFTFVLLLLAGGYYLHENLPRLVERQLEIALADRGVRDITIDGLSIAPDLLVASDIEIHGEQDGLAFNVSLRALGLRYHWREVLQGQFHSLALEQLDITLEAQAGTATSTATATAQAIRVSEFLPQSLITLLPVDTVNIRHWQLVYHRSDTSALVADGSLSIANGMHLSAQVQYMSADWSVDLWTDPDTALRIDLQLAQNQIPLANVNAQLAQAPAQRWQWTLAGSVDYAPALQWAANTSDLLESADIRSTLSTLSLQGRSQISGTLEHDDRVILGTAESSGVLRTMQATLAASHTIDSLEFPGVLSGTGKLGTTIDLQAGRVLLAVDPVTFSGAVANGLMGLSSEQLQWLGWKDSVPLRLESSAPVRLTREAEGSFTVQSPDLQAALGTTRSELRLEKFAAAGTLPATTPHQIEMQLDTLLRLRLQQRELPLTTWSAGLKGAPEQSVYNIMVNDEGATVKASLEGTLDLGTGKGEHLLSLRSVDLSKAAAKLMPLLKKFDLVQQDIAITQGSMALTSKLQSGGLDMASLEQQATLKLDNLHGRFQDYAIETLGLQASWAGTQLWQSRSPIILTVARIDLGVDVTDIRAELTLPRPTPYDSPNLMLQSATARIFGGRLYLAAPTPWDMAAPVNSFVLRAQGWQLADIVALREDNDIEAQGILDGELPATVSSGRITIDRGSLQARPPGGRIRYNASESTRKMATSSAELALALGLLDNLQYEVLRSDVSLDQEGILLLALAIGGKNPEQFEGRRINFNINLEQNLDPLLQSLRLSDTLVEEIERRQR